MKSQGEWSQNSRVAFTKTPTGAVVRNVADERLTSPIQGFGRLWRKQYRVSLAGTDATPEEVVAIWKAEFGQFWPNMAHFYGSSDRITVGESALINMRVAGLTMLSTGILVLFEDDRSFTFMTPEGHVFAAWITFSADTVDKVGGVPYAQVEVLIRASDPLFELLMALGGARAEDWQWRTVLKNLAQRVGANPVKPTVVRECVDRRRQWRYARNVRGNAALLTFAYTLRHPRGGNRRPPTVAGPR